MGKDKSWSKDGYLNSSLYLEVLKKRRELGLPEAQTYFKVKHDLIGKEIRYRGKLYKVVSAHRQWWGCWFTSLLIEQNNSHGILIWESDGRATEFIAYSIEENRKVTEIIA